MGRPPKRKAPEVANASASSSTKQDVSNKAQKKRKIEPTASSTRPHRMTSRSTNAPRVTRSLSNGTPANVTPIKSSSKAKQPIDSSSPKKSVGRPKKYNAQMIKTSGLRNEDDLPNDDNDVQTDLSVAVPTAKEKSKVKTKVKNEAVDQSGEEADADADADGRQYWLMKAEPDSRIEKGKDVKFSIDDLKAATSPEPWDGVRNLEARNNMRAMTKGDLAFFYHSNCKVPGIVGVMEIVQEHTVDETAFDPEHPYYDEKSSREKPKWHLVHVAFRQKFPEVIKLKDLQKFSKERGQLEDMQTLKRTRLSVSKVSKKEWDFIMSLVDVEAASAQYQPQMITNGTEANLEAGSTSAEPNGVNGGVAEVGLDLGAPVDGLASTAGT